MGHDVTVSITGFEPVRLGSNPSDPTNIVMWRNGRRYGARECTDA
jgi:hypothetical protein